MGGPHSVITHNHSHIIFDLPVAPGGNYPTKNLKISVLHNARMKAWDTSGKIIEVKGKGSTWAGVSTASFSYTNPELLSIQNKYMDQRPKWRNTPGCLMPGVDRKYCGPDSGDSAGWYATLHGSNFGEGCGGNCSGNISLYKDKIGKIRWMAERYEVVDPNMPAEVYNFWEEVNAETEDVDCTCFAKYGMKSKGSECDVCKKKCTESEAACTACQTGKTTKCPPILYWDHTRIIFYVREGTGRDLPLQVEVGEQKNCEVSKKTHTGEIRKKNFADRHKAESLFWCKLDHHTGKCLDDKSDACDDTRKKLDNDECQDTHWCNKHIPDQRCFCSNEIRKSSYLAVAGGRKGKLVTINYNVPVIDKVTPDVIAGHQQVSDVETKQKIELEIQNITTQLELHPGNRDLEEELQKAIYKNKFELFPPPTIGEPGELITISGTGFGSQKSFPQVTIDGYECRDAQLVRNDKVQEPFITHGWYKINLAKDRKFDANETRESIGPYLNGETFIPWTKICISGNTTETKRVEWILDGQKCRVFEDAAYDADAKKYIVSNEGRECINEKGKPMECCLQHQCDEAYGWVGKEKKDRSKAAEGCILPHDAFGDPRYYKYREQVEGCVSHTIGWWIWEEDYSWHFGKPLRVKEQKVGEVKVKVDPSCEGTCESGCECKTQPPVESKCVKDRWHRDVCPYVLPCEPLEACLGDNKCALGYAGKKCNKCGEGFFRKEGFCVTCPNNPTIMIAMIIVAMLCISTVFYIIKKLKINIGVISIGIDYFQVLGLFNNSLIPWPEEMTALYNYLSSFSFSVDLASPECVGSGMSSYQKWFMTEFIPIFIVMGVAIYCLFQITIMLPMKKVDHHRRQLMGQATSSFNMGTEITKTIGSGFSIFLSVFYLMYVNLVKKAMDIFNCAAGDPPDSEINPTKFMAMQPDQVCFQPGNWDTGLHVKLIPYAIAAVACCGLAFPTFVFFKFYKNRKIIFEDQLLAAQDRGEKPISNPNYAFRKRYSSLYKNFKPKKMVLDIMYFGSKIGHMFHCVNVSRDSGFPTGNCMLCCIRSVCRATSQSTIHGYG